MLFRLMVAVVVVGGGLARAQSMDPDVEAARRHFSRALEYYDAQRYADAVVELQKAKALRQSSAFDYNIARCYERLEKWQEAGDAYQRYLDAEPNAPERDELKHRIAVLRARGPDLPPPAEAPHGTAPVAKPMEAPQAVVVATPPPRRSFGKRYGAAIGLGAGALALAVVGSALVGSVAPDYDKLDSGPQSCRPCAPSQYSGLVARADAGYALWAVAGAAAVVDVGLFIAAARHK